MPSPKSVHGPQVLNPMCCKVEQMSQALLQQSTMSAQVEVSRSLAFNFHRSHCFFPVLSLRCISHCLDGCCCLVACVTGECHGCCFGFEGRTIDSGLSALAPHLQHHTHTPHHVACRLCHSLAASRSTEAYSNHCNRGSPADPCDYVLGAVCLAMLQLTSMNLPRTRTLILI